MPGGQKKSRSEWKFGFRHLFRLLQPTIQIKNGIRVRSRKIMRGEELLRRLGRGACLPTQNASGTGSLAPLHIGRFTKGEIAGGRKKKERRKGRKLVTG